MKSDNFLKSKLDSLGIKELKKRDVVIDHHAVWSDESSPFEFKTVVLNDLDEVKKLIGNHDHLFENGSLKHSKHMELATGIRELTHENVSTAAHAYVYGHSKPLRHLKEQIEKIIGPIQVHVATEDKIVISQPLVIQPGAPKQLVANQIVFQDQGQIICYGVLGINAGCLINQKNV